MHLASFVVVLCAGLAIASPVVKKALYTKVVTTVVYEYVTVTALPLGLPYAETTMVGSPKTDYWSRSHHHPSPSPCTSHSTATGVSNPQVSLLSTSTSALALSLGTSESPVSPTTTTTVVLASELPTTKISPLPTTTTSESPPPHIATSAVVSQPFSTKSPTPLTTEAPPAAATPATSEPLSTVLPIASPVITVSATSSLDPGTDYSSALLYHHNIHRRNHSSPDAVWDATLASYAAKVADSCIYAHDTSPGGGGYGQNIAAASYPGRSDYNATYLGCSAVTDLFYNSEFGNFLPSYYGLPGPAPGISGWDHFSQILWAASTGVGCATTLCDAGKIFSYPTWYTVCNYSPQGNVGGAYGINVGTPLGQETQHVI